MDIKRLITHFTYRIEPKAEGGFVAHASDPNLPPLEAPTRLELQEKIRQNISAALADEFPELRLPLEQENLKLSFHIERKGDGGFLIHSDDPNNPQAQAASHEIESKFAEKLIAFAGKHLAQSGMSDALAANLASGNVKVFVSKNTTTRTIFGSTDAGDGATPSSGVDDLVRSAGSQVSDALAQVHSSEQDSPIHRTTESRSGFLRFLIALLILGAIAYVYLRFR